MIRPGDLVRLSNVGGPVSVAPVPPIQVPRAYPAYPAGTLALLLEIGEIGVDGPDMETTALVMIGDVIGHVLLYECEEIRDETR